MAYKTMIDPNGTGPLDHVEAYVADDGSVYYPGDEGYVAPENPSTVQAEVSDEPTPVEVSQAAMEQEAEEDRIQHGQIDEPVEGQSKEGASVDPASADNAGEK